MGVLLAALMAGCGDDACEPGFERDGGVCVDSRLKFVGMWSGVDTCDSGGAGYTFEIALDPATPDGLLISPFSNFFENPVRASLSDETLIIARQRPDVDWFVEGTGTPVGTETEEVSAEFIFSDESDPTSIVLDNCTSTWTKVPVAE